MKYVFTKYIQCNGNIAVTQWPNFDQNTAIAIETSPAQKAAYTLPDGQNPYYIKIFIRSCLAYNLKLAQMAEWLRQ